MDTLIVVGTVSALLCLFLVLYGAVAFVARIPAVRAWMDEQMPERPWWDQ